jgi:hypothetical protein
MRASRSRSVKQEPTSQEPASASSSDRRRKSTLAANNHDDDENDLHDSDNDVEVNRIRSNDTFTSLCAMPCHIVIPKIDVRENTLAKWNRLPEGTRDQITKVCTRLLLMKGRKRHMA